MPRGYLQNASSGLQTRENSWGRLNRAIWLVYWTDTNTLGRLVGLANVRVKKLHFDIILQHDWPIEQYLLHIRFSLAGKRRVHLLILWPTKQIANTYRRSRSSENRSKTFISVIYECIHCFRVLIAPLINYTCKSFIKLAPVLSW